jgi:hypothetical protein
MLPAVNRPFRIILKKKQPLSWRSARCSSPYSALLVREKMQGTEARDAYLWGACGERNSTCSNGMGIL